MQSAPLLNHKVQLLRNYFNIFEQCTSFGLNSALPGNFATHCFFQTCCASHIRQSIEKPAVLFQTTWNKKGTVIKVSRKTSRRSFHLYSFYFYSNLYRRHLRPMWLFPITGFDFFSEMEQLQRDRLSKILGYFIWFFGIFFGVWTFCSCVLSSPPSSLRQQLISVMVMMIFAWCKPRLRPIGLRWERQRKVASKPLQPVPVKSFRRRQSWDKPFYFVNPPHTNISMVTSEASL